MSTRDDKRKKKEKEKEKDKESDCFDPNIATDSVKGPSTLTDGSNESGESSKSVPARNRTSINELEKLGKIFQEGFKSVNSTISTKLDDVAVKFTKGLDDLHSKLDKRMTELSEPPADDLNLPENSDDDFDSSVNKVNNWDVHSDGAGSADRGSTHAMSESSTQSAKKKSYFKEKNVPPPQEKLGNKVDEDLSEIANRAFKKACTSEMFTSLVKDKYPRPANVEWVKTPEVPYNVYRRLSSDYKDKDKLLKQVQENFVPVASSLVHALDKLGSGDLNGGLDILSDTLLGFGYAFTSITDKRRFLIKPKLPDDYKGLISEDCPPTPANLLGDISENTKKISETDKITAQMDKHSKSGKEKGKKNSNYKSKPYDRSSSSSSRGYRGGFFNRRFSNQRRSNNDYGSNNNSYNNRSDHKSNFRRGGGQNRK